MKMSLLKNYHKYHLFIIYYYYYCLFLVLVTLGSSIEKLKVVELQF